MESIHDAGEWLRLSEHYRQMTDGELLAIARNRDKLTESAQQVLAMELAARKLTLEPEKGLPSLAATSDNTTTTLRSHPATPPRGSPAQENIHGDTGASAYGGDPYEEDRGLVEILTVWSLSDGLQVQRLLDVSGIPFYMGAEKATSVDEVRSNFAQGVSVQVMRIGAPWATEALKNYYPKDVPESEKAEWREEVNVKCPSCGSEDIVFEELVERADGGPKYKWTCSSCGYEWEDDGVAK